MKYNFDPLPPFQLTERRGRSNTAEATFGGPLTPGQQMPGSVKVQLKIQGYPRWRSLDPGMRDTLRTPVSDPRWTVNLAKALSARFYPAFREFFLVMAVDNRGRVVAWYVAAVGTGSTVQISMQDIFRNLVILPTSTYIVIHNHPSGDPTPSREDIALTEQLQSGGALLGLKLLDHIIIGADGAFVSLAELGHIY